MADLPSGDGTSESANMADFALNLADQLINAFQQTAEGAGDGEGEVIQDDGAVPSDNGETDTEAEARDGNDEWQELAEEDYVDGYDNGVKGEGVGEENPKSCLSPLGSHDCVTEGSMVEHLNEASSSDVMFAPARVLNFDDSDGDDLSAVDQRFIPRGVFVQSDFMDDRPALHGSEEVDYYASSGRANMLLGDHSQNVRIIEGHDDLDLDRGAGYMSLTMRNHFLQTQMVQLPTISAEDHNASAHLYDSLEREEEEFYPRDDQGDESEQDLGGDGFSGAEYEDDRDADPLNTDGHIAQEGLLLAASGNGSEARAMKREEDECGSVYDEAAVKSPSNVELGSVSPVQQDREPDQLSMVYDTQVDSMIQPSASEEVQSRSSGLVVTLPKSSSSVANQAEDSGANPEPGKAESSEQPPPRTKQVPNKRQPRGGPAGSNGREARNPGNRPQTRANLNPTDQRPGLNSRARNIAGVGSARQMGSGAQNQRPAVQGAAVTAAGISGGGDGDGAVAGSGSLVVQGQGNPQVVGSMLLSRTSSQGSIHSNASSVSNSRVSGVGKESNNTRYNQPRSGRSYAAIPGSQGPAARPVPSQHQTQSSQQSQAPLPPQRSAQQPRAQSLQSAGQQSLGRPTSRPPPTKQGGGAASHRASSRSAQLQQQQNQLQQEQQRLLQKHRQLQQQQQQQHQQQQLQLGGMESPDGDNLVHHQPDAVVTQVSHMQQESHRQERSGGVSSTTEVQGMEEVRSALQSMLRLPREASAFDQRDFDFADSASDLLIERPTHFQHEGDVSSMPGFRSHAHEDSGEMFDSFPSFSLKMFSEMSNISLGSDRSMHSENAYLRDCLEKERYRRKHCEQQIQSLNAKLLEIQQQLAVAVSTDKRKDIMIDQLDKQLAKVVEGWKKREAEKDEYMVMVMKEKAQIEETLHKQQAMIDSFEKELASTVEELKQEKENSADMVDKMKAQLSSAVHEQRHAEEVLAAEKERCTLMEKEWDQLKESRDLAEKRAQQAQDRLHQEQDSWYQREQELMHKIDQVKEANLKVMQMKRVKLEEQTKKAEEMEDKVHTAETNVKRLEMEVDSAVREKESMKVEMALMEAKFESAQRSLEADLHAQMEREISEQVRDVQERMRQEQEEQGEKHRQMVSELHLRHQRDLDVQLASLRQDLSRREEDLKQQLADVESRMGELRQENSSLKQAKQKLESQRLEVLNKLQFIMQSQWNEAVSLLVTTPQRKTLNTSMSSLGSSLMGGAGLQGGATTTTTTTATSTNPHFAFSSGAQSGATAPAVSVGPSSLPDQTRPLGEPSSFNNLSGSQSPPPSQGHVHTTSISTADSRGQQQAQQPRGPLPFTAESGVTLQDLTALLSESHQLPPNMGSHIHGVTHHGGLLVHTLQGSDLTNQPHPHHPTHHPTHHPVTRQDVSDPQAVLIRPPQQSSRPSHNISGVSTSDISHSESSLSLQQDAAQWGQLFAHDGEGDSVRSEESHRRQNFSSDRMLELRDLEVEPQVRRPDDMLMVSTRRGQGASREEASLMERSAAGYSPSMSPPVKQGRDGEQDSTDGSVLHETDRLNSSYREISRQLEEHQSRQRELQHYIKLLLDKPPQAHSDQPERDSIADPDVMDISFGSVAVDLGLTDAAQAAQLNTELQRLQQLRDRQTSVNQFSQSQSARPKSSTKKPDSTRNLSHSQSQPHRAGTVTAQHQETGVLAPHQLAEISRLLNQYNEDVEASQGALPLGGLQADPSSMAQILHFLSSLPQQQGRAEGGERSSSTKSSPRQQQQQSRRTRDQQRAKKQSDIRHHSVGPDSSLSSVSLTSDRDRVMTSSTRSTTATATTSSLRRTEKKLANTTSTSSSSAPSSSTSGRQGARPPGRDQHPAWKSSGQKSAFSKLPKK